MNAPLDPASTPGMGARYLRASQPRRRRLLMAATSLCGMAFLCCSMAEDAGTDVALAVPNDIFWVLLVLTCVGTSMAGSMLLLCRRRTQALETRRRLQQEYSMRLIDLQEEERRRIAHELHDSLGQDLLLIKTAAELELGSLELDSGPARRLRQIQSVATNALRGVRSITGGLRPPELDRLGLAAAIEAMAEKVMDTAGVRVEWDVHNLDAGMGKREEINLYRIIQESLTNALKHAGAKHIQIEAQRCNGDLRIEIKDDGCGFETGAELPMEQGGGMGLPGLEERARGLGGSLCVESTPGAGTRVRIEVPVLHNESKSAG